jgi:ATP-dependent DNA helicase RecG
LSKEDKTWACFCHCVIRFLIHQRMTNQTLRERFSLPAEDYQAVSAVIGWAIKDGLVKPEDPAQGRRYAKYVPYWV